MAKALAFNRATQQVETVDTVNNAVTALGGVIATAELTNAFPGRSENLGAVFLGESYFLYRDNTNAIKLAKLIAGVWTNVVGFPGVAIPTGAGQLAPLALMGDRQRLIAIVGRSASAATDGNAVRVSTDGVTWTAPFADIATPIQPTPSQGGNSVLWRNTLFFAHAAGISWTSPTAATQAPGYDTGSDGLLANTFTPYGHFVFWRGTLYFVKAGPVPALYSLDPNWNPATPTAAPAWTRIVATGIPSVVALTPGPDVGTLLAFVNKAGNFCIAYSGSAGSKLVQTTSASFPAFTDLTTTVLPVAINMAANLGFSIFVDDRRRVNELQSILIRDVLNNQMILATWDGAVTFTIRATFTGMQLMLSDDRFGELRTYTAIQPAAFITAETQPFPGRVSIAYTVRDTLSRKVDTFGEYSVTGDSWLPMTEGSGDDGGVQLTSSPAGIAHTFFWDAFVDLDGDLPFVFTRIVARLSGV